MPKGKIKADNNKITWVFSRIATIIIAVLAVLQPIINFSWRIVFVSVNSGTFAGFSEILLAIMLVNAVFLTVVAFVKTTGKDILGKRFIRIIYIISFSLTILFTILNTIYIITTTGDIYAFYQLLRLAPYLAVLFGALFFVCVFPRIKKGRAVVGGVLIAVITIALLISAAGALVFRFASEPLVIDTGEGYRIVWATNAPSKGWVEYTYQGENHTVYHTESGRTVAERIHRVDVPYSHLDGSSYTVHARRVIDELGYGGQLGRTISSNTYNFRGEIKDDMVIWSLSDWHHEIEKLYSTVEYMDEPDVVILLGDYVNAMYEERDIIKYILAPAAKITNGSCPVIFARGNHETRGGYANELGTALGMDTYYHEVVRGKYRFIVLDTNEDKPDNHIEYGGMADFAPYRKEQGEWLAALPQTDAEYVVVVAHDPELCIEEEQAAVWVEELKRLGASFQLSGHHHKSEIFEENDILTILDGGRFTAKINNRKRKVFVGTEIKVSGENIAITAYDNLGNTYLNETHGIAK
ncbi:MAG: metallophosphoesterase [Clostridia bacterium]